ncbi:hypothetical protein EYF80_046086 [Liparis tanakae]|uniref:Uncharacterized protein n=1 Tax=Liparis tanakae TaxID=230148 RepID=A0A4Z2FRX2_9TELE|nr:hypothetical protein EYF80_046086 [Liparis tanakae]
MFVGVGVAAPRSRTQRPFGGVNLRPVTASSPDTRCFSDSMILVTGLRCTVNVWKSCGPEPTVSGCCTMTRTAPLLVPMMLLSEEAATILSLSPCGPPTTLAFSAMRSRVQSR